jgi:hypothetical protein
MDQVEKKKALVERLANYHKSLDVEQLYVSPDHKKSKDWLAGVAAVFKNLDEADYKEFVNHRQHLYKVILRTTRKHAAEQIDSFIRQKVAEYELYDFTSPETHIVSYVPKTIIDSFLTKKDKFNYKKLNHMLDDLNENYSKQKQYACAMLIRAVLDHVPPLLGFITFDQVVNDYHWNQTDKVHMKSLLAFKDDAHDALHRIISEDEDLLELSNLPNSNRFNRLLQECLKRGGDTEFIKAKQLSGKKEPKATNKIEISLVESGTQSWQSYSISHYMSYSFKFVLDIDNFKSSKLDYVWVYLKADSKEGEWKGEHYVFEKLNANADTPYEVEAGKQSKVTVCVSDQTFGRGNEGHRFRPDIDMDTLVLCVKTKSGESFDLPIKVMNS